MRVRRGTHCFSRWRGINAFIRHPKTGRGITLRRVQEVCDVGYSKGAGYDPLDPIALGIFLENARVRRLLSLEQVADKTRLSRYHIKAIEAGAFDELPGGLFNRTFVQIYARALEIPESSLSPFYSRRPQDADAVAAAELPPANERSITTAGCCVKPPRLSEFLLYLFLSKSERVNLIGDTEEEFSEVFEKFGRRKANFWFRKQVFDSLWPLIWRSLKKASLIVWLWKYGEVIIELLYRKIK